MLQGDAEGLTDHGRAACKFSIFAPPLLHYVDAESREKGADEHSMGCALSVRDNV